VQALFIGAGQTDEFPTVFSPGGVSGLFRQANLFCSLWIRACVQLHPPGSRWSGLRGRHGGAFPRLDEKTIQRADATGRAIVLASAFGLRFVGQNDFVHGNATGDGRIESAHGAASHGE